MTDQIKKIDGREFVSIELCQQLYSAKGFRLLFEQKMKQTQTYLQSYEEVERLHVMVFGIRRYSGYQSFATASQKSKPS